MKPYHVIILDDEPLALDVLEHYLKNFPDYEVKKRFTDPVQALRYINSGVVDLVFTDIAMPHISGTELVALVKDKTRFIMTTSYSDYAIESFELNVVDYLLKPIAFERFSKAIDHFEKQQVTVPSQPLKASFFIKEGDEFIKINIDDIDYIEGMKDYAKIVTGHHFYLALKTLKSLEKLLKNKQFLRVHKSYIVPLAKITQYTGKSILIDKHDIPVGSSYRTGLKAFLEAHKL